MLEKALELARAGFWIFPLKAGAKEPPLIREFQTEATRDPARIKRWWTKWPDANIGVSTTRFGKDEALVVVDVDCKEGREGDLTLQKLAVFEGLELDPTFTVTTPTGGRHLYFRSPAPEWQGANVLGTHVDIRSRHGYVVGPGSVVPDGAYIVASDAPDTLAPVMGWVVEKCRAREAARSASSADTPRPGIDRVLAERRAIDFLAPRKADTAGGRNDAGFAVACRLRDFGVEYGDAFPIMREHWRCDPPLEDGELNHVIDSAYRYGRNQPGVDAVETYFDVVTPEQVAAVEAEEPATPGLELLRDKPGTKPPVLRLVKGLLREGGLSLWVADPDGGKTTVLQDLALHVAHATPWMHRSVTQGSVLFCCFERTDDVQGRLDAFYQEHPELDRDSAAFAYVNVESRALATGGTAAAICDAAARMEKEHGPVRLIVVDTLAAALHGDENDSAVVGDFMRALKFVKNKTGAHVAVTHHLGKNKTAGARGHSKLQGDFDSVFSMEEGTITASKLKGAKGWKLYYGIKIVSIGKDEDGDDVTSVALFEAKGPTATHGSADHKAIEALRTCAAVEPPDELAIEGVEVCVLRKDWLQTVAALAPDGNRAPRKWASNLIGRILRLGMSGLTGDKLHIWSKSADGVMLFGEAEDSS